jgi:hypothetical protein
MGRITPEGILAMHLLLLILIILAILAIIVFLVRGRRL